MNIKKENYDLINNNNNCNNLNLTEYKIDIGNIAKAILEANSQTFSIYFDQNELNKSIQLLDKSNPSSSCSSSSSSSSSNNNSSDLNLSQNKNFKNNKEIFRLLNMVT